MTDIMERVLDMVRWERARQIEIHGHNDDLELGFGGSVSTCAWLAPYSADNAQDIQKLFRIDYVSYEEREGNPTWMHLIREEVAELFETEDFKDMVAEAVQVAALCVSLVEHLIKDREERHDEFDSVQ